MPDRELSVDYPTVAGRGEWGRGTAVGPAPARFTSIRAAAARRPWLVALALVLLLSPILIRDLARTPEEWPYVIGYEYEWVASCLLEEGVYGFPGEHRVLFNPAAPEDRTEPGVCYPTARQEPVYTGLLAAAFWLFGEDGRPIMVALQVLALAGTLAIVYAIGRRIAGPVAGGAAAVGLILVPPSLAEALNELSNAPLAGLMIAGCALLGLRLLERPSLGRAAVFGAVAGVGALTHAVFLIVAPLFAVALVAPGLRLGPPAWRAAAVAVLTAAVFVAPWTVRNYVVFGEAVPVRSSLGFMLFSPNVSLARVWGEPSVGTSPVPVPWTAAGPVEAWNKAGEPDHLLSLDAFTTETLRATTGPGFGELNEVERDRLLTPRAIAFFLDNPATALQLVAIKLTSFFLHGAGGFPVRRGVLVTLPALLGVALAWRDRRVRTLALLALAYGGVHALTAAYYYRHRYPIEPVLCVLAGVAIAAAWTAFARVWRRPGEGLRPYPSA